MKTIITLKNGETVTREYSREAAQAVKNVNALVFAEFAQTDVQNIGVERHNEAMGNDYIETTFDARLEPFKCSGQRVEIVTKFGEDTLETSRCYIGKSTGWVPIYLEIKQRNSSCGAGLFPRLIQSIRPMGLRRF